jgi:hypothetical protein
MKPTNRSTIVSPACAPRHRVSTSAAPAAQRSRCLGVLARVLVRPPVLQGGEHAEQALEGVHGGRSAVRAARAGLRSDTRMVKNDRKVAPLPLRPLRQRTSLTVSLTSHASAKAGARCWPPLDPTSASACATARSDSSRSACVSTYLSAGTPGCLTAHLLRKRRAEGLVGGGGAGSLPRGTRSVSLRCARETGPPAAACDPLVRPPQMRRGTPARAPGRCSRSTGGTAVPCARCPAAGRWPALAAQPTGAGSPQCPPAPATGPS